MFCELRVGAVMPAASASEPNMFAKKEEKLASAARGTRKKRTAIATVTNGLLAKAPCIARIIETPKVPGSRRLAAIR